MSDTELARKAFELLKQEDPDYFEKMLAQRCQGHKLQAGSFYRLSLDEIQEALLSTEWERFEPKQEDQVPGCVYLKAPLAGFSGLIKLTDLSDQTSVRLIDPKDTKKLSVAIDFKECAELTLTQESTLILGPNSLGTLEVWTVHPGLPVSPSQVPLSDKLPVDTVITVKEARSMGFDWAKASDLTPLPKQKIKM